MPKRNRIDIIESMLFWLSQKGNMKQTHLMYKSNLSYKQLKAYLEELVQESFVSRKKTNKSNFYITITEQDRKSVV